MDKKAEVFDSCGESHAESESNEDTTKKVADSGDLKDGVLDTEFRDDKTEEQVNAKGDLHSESQDDDTAEGVHENSAHRDLELQVEETMDMKEGTLDTVPPVGVGRAAPLLEPAPRVVQQPRAKGSASNTQSQQIEEYLNGEAEEYDDTREKLQMIRVKFLRLAHRLGETPRNLAVVQVLCRLGLAELLRGRNGGHVGAFSFDRASAMAEQLEAVGQEPLDFSCTIMVLGKTGVGKSATINSIFDNVMFSGACSGGVEPKYIMVV